MITQNEIAEDCGMATVFEYADKVGGALLNTGGGVMAVTFNTNAGLVVVTEGETVALYESTEAWENAEGYIAIANRPQWERLNQPWAISTVQDAIDAILAISMGERWIYEIAENGEDGYSHLEEVLHYAVKALNA
jgi:hypothetical protein